MLYGSSESKRDNYANARKIQQVYRITEVPIGIEAETRRLSLFYKGFAHLVDFLARAYGHFGFRHRGWKI
jgi:hypothetical protein